MLEKDGKVPESNNLPFPEPGEDVVISGIAGRFPESDNLTELRNNLFNKVNLITEDDRRWQSNNPDIPTRAGKVNNLEKFDASFFGATPDVADMMDPMARMLMEHAYEAIVDAGVNPQQLHGTNTGVFIGTCYLETEKKGIFEEQLNGFGLIGCARAMLANRISRWFGCNGPSYSIDTACSSSLYVLDHAYRAIRSGECDAALIGACNLCLHPTVTLQFSLLGVLSPEGRCKSFDADGNGYCRSEAVAVIYLQKLKNARRIYARVVHSKTNCDGFKEEGITFPSKTMQAALLRQIYGECKVAPSDLAFVEAHATGTKAGDPVEISALDKIFCPSRETPLRVGSVKSNLGHPEPASGICSIAKVLIAMESGYIPGNLHYNRPREEIEALADGRVQVITELTPWEGGYVGINSFGFGGANAHVLLKSNPKEKVNNGQPKDDLPRLVVVSGRTQEAVITLLRNLESSPVDAEYVSLFHNIYGKEIPHYPYRGYTILPPHGLPKNCISDVQRYHGVKRPVWFVFSGLGLYGADVGKTLLKIPIFARAIRRCADALNPYGVDIIKILTDKNRRISDNIVHSLVRITAIQIGLVDVMSAVGIVPDNIIGYSEEELSCAYADGCLTTEQTILAAYFQALVLEDNKSALGSMATVALNKIRSAEPCLPDIDIADQNSTESSVVSGSAKSEAKFLAKSKTDGISAQDDLCANVAYHNRYIATAAPKLLHYLRKIIPNPKPLSTKWIRSTFVSYDKWKISSAWLCSPEFLTNNLLSPIPFRGMCDIIPHKAITIEIAPRSSLQAISNSNVINIPLIDDKYENTVEVLLQAIGNMYGAGLYPQLINLYPSVWYPVSRGTPMISPLIRWDHSLDHHVISYKKGYKIDAGERQVEVKLFDGDFEWMSGHIIDGRNLLPATGYLVLIWETLGFMEGEIYSEMSVTFEDIRFHRATTIPKEGGVILTLMIHKGTGRFEVAEGDTTVVTGFIHTLPNSAKEHIDVHTSVSDKAELHLTSSDIYKELRLHGYQYTGLFRGLKAASSDVLRGRIEWKKNWVVFMDNMLQFKMLSTDMRGLFVATRIQKLVIDVETHSEQLSVMPNNEKEFPVQFCKHVDNIVSGGIQIRGLKASIIARKEPAGDPVLEDCKFIAHRDRAEMKLEELIRMAMHIALENHLGNKIKTIELINEDDEICLENLTTPLIQKVLDDLPLLHADVHVVGPAHKFSSYTLPPGVKLSDSNKLIAKSDTLFGVMSGLSKNKDSKTFNQLQKALVNNGFILIREPLNKHIDIDISSIISSDSFDVILEKRTREKFVVLLRKKEKLSEIYTVLSIDNNEFIWLSKLQDALKVENQRQRRNTGRILLVSENDFESGVMGLVNCLRKEPGGQAIQGLLIQDSKAPKFSLENSFYSDQLKLGLTLNVLRPGKVWGSYRFFAMNPLTLRPVYHAQISQLKRGDLSTMEWVDGGIQPNTQTRDLIEIHFSSINIRDFMLGTGKLAVEVIAKTKQLQTNFLGCEFSGRDVNGRAVMGMIESGALSNLCICDKELLWQVPDDWTLEDAATVPTAYATAYYALHLSGKMKKGDKVLIHAGSGGVGQAAIAIALYEGCEVFTTVGTPEKRAFIKNQFPQIDDDHIGNSRDTSFEQMILCKTHGQGVDIVLNSLAEEKLQASVRCLAVGGRFLEIGKFDLAANNIIGMEHFLKGISFHGILLDNLFTACPEKKRELATMFTKGLESGVIKPLVRTVFAMDQVGAAFRYIAAGKHFGKVIIKMRDENESRQSPQMLALSRYHCSDDGSYLILGGLGGFGLELADWLVLRGAKKLVLTSRRGISNGYQRMRINIWKSYGVKVVVIAGKDASIRDDCEAILNAANALGPVEAIFNLAVVLKDALFENQTIESFEESLRVKAWATKQLDILSRSLCPRLKKFVVFSSVSCGRGNVGQTNYGMANSIMERICEARTMENLPGLAIQWGAVGDVGLVAEMQENHQEVVIGGTLQQSIISCLKVLDEFLQQDSPIVSSMVVAEKKTREANNISEAVVNIMGLKDLKTVSLHTPLAELGMDSMMAIEIKQMLEQEYEIYLTLPEIRSMNFAKVQRMSLKGGKESKTSRREDDTDFDGLKILLQTVGTVQFNPDICVPLKMNGKSEEVFLLPGIEGTCALFQSLAGKLKSPTTCLQLGLNFSNLTTICEMANYFLPHVKTRKRENQEFTIVGYSFGSLVAIELVRRLESEGQSCRLVLIDGSPDYTKTLFSQEFGNVSDNELQSNVLNVLVDILLQFTDTTFQFAFELEKCNSWEEKLAAFTKSLSRNGILHFTPEEGQALCLSIYFRIKAVHDYDCSAFPPLRTSIILIKPEIKSVQSMSEDYGLSSLTQGKVEIHYAKGNHQTMLEDDICAAAIDGQLSKNAICT